MPGFPHFILYEADGSTPVYEFQFVTDINDFQDPSDFIEHTSLRGQGSIIVEGSDQPWDLSLTFIIKGTDYADLVDQMDSIQSTIAKFTRYILKIDITPSSTKDYYVQRLQSIQFPLTNSKKRVDIQTVQVIFRVNSWA